MKKIRFYIVILVALFSSTAMAQDNGLSFDGTDDYVSFASNAAFNSTRTFEAWIYPTTTTGFQTIAEWTDGVDNILRFYMNNNRLVLLEDDGFNGGIVTGTGTITANQWNHVVFVETGSGFIFYIDGVADPVGFPTGSAGPTPIFNLGSIRAGFNYFEGIIDEVRVWSTELAQATIENQRFSELTGAEANLIAYYQFNETTGTVLPDLTTNNIDGTLLNGLANTPPADGVTNGPLWVASTALPDPFIVTNINNSGTGSLRWCLGNANATPGANTITFDFVAVPPGSQINIDSELTLSDNSTTINADQGNDGKPDIILASGNAGINGFRITSSNNVIRGFNLIQFANGLGFPAAIKITGPTASGNVILANYIGTGIGGGPIAFPGNYRAIRIDGGASNNQIGDGTLVGQNLISNNQLSGIQIADATSTGNRITGNIIGLDASGSVDLGNSDNGIEITNAAGTLIGSIANGRNIISGNGSAGIEVNNAPNTSILNNYIGTSLDGNTDLGNDNEGITILGTSNGSLIGNGIAGNGNLISGNTGQGVLISTSDITVLGNIIGLNAAGNTALPNSNIGLDVAAGAINTIIGNGTATGRNIVSGNASHGIRIREGSNTIEGNYIGLGVDGVQLLGNNGIGVFVTAGTDTFIGGNTAGAGNVISGNAAGISISSGPNFVYGNIIGLDVTATIVKANNGEGIRITANGDANEIGDGTLGGANIIAGNADNGVLLSGSTVTGNALNVNYIGTNTSGDNLGNGLAGIRLETGSSGNSIPQNIIAYNQTGILATGNTTQLNLWTQNSIYANGTGISILAGAQGGVSPPTITSVPLSGAVTGTSAPLALVDIYADAGDQGEFLYGVATADASGNWTCTCLGPTSTIPPGLTNITATQTDPGINNSSEFSTPFAIPPPANPFITTWTTTDGQLTIPTFGIGYNYDIIWTNLTNSGVGDGATSGETGNYAITGLENGSIYQIEISGNFPRIYFNNSSPNRDKILTIEQWGDISWTSMADAFEGCVNLTIPAVDAPDLSNVTDMSRMFSGAESITESLDHWDVSNITSMASTFRNAVAFNGNISNWDVSNVVDFFQCFSGASVFNQPLNWSINNTPGASVTMLGMFSYTPFNQDLSTWDVSEVVNMSQMFWGNVVFNGNITNWDVRKVTSFSLMFRDNPSFNQDISNWQLNSALSISQMFLNATSFNQPIGNWGASTGNITDMSGTFRNADAFNQPIDAWDVSSVTNMDEMFTFSDLFNQELNSWDMSNVQSVRRMFWSSAAFNGNIADWDLSSCIVFNEMFLTAQAFDQPLNWTLNTNAFANIQMDGMFEGSIFNQDISSWNVSRVQSMNDMFKSNTVFNGSVAGWDVSNVQIFSEMFDNAQSFDQSLASWDVVSAVLMDNMLRSSGMSVANYDATLIGWSSLPSLQSGVTLGAAGLNYCTAATARNNIITTYGWTISDSGLLCPATIPLDPASLFVTEVSSTQLELSWTDNSLDETGFIIERSDGNNATFVPLITVGADVTTYSDNSVTPGNGYFYRVIATNAAGDSGPSNEKFGSTIAPPGYALDFDGIDDYVDLGNLNDIFVGNEGSLTIEFWFNSPPTGSENEVLLAINGSGGANDNQLLLIIRTDNQIALNDDSNTATQEIIGPVVTDNEWHHLAYTRNGTLGTLYLDGTVVGTHTADFPINAGDLWSLGQEYDGIASPGNFYDGLLDEVRIWNTVRSETDINANLYSTFIGNEAGLIAYYRFDQGIPGGDNTTPPIDLLPDRSTNNFNGSLIGFGLIGASSNWVESQVAFAPFLTIWITTDGQITIPTTGTGYNYDVTWTNLDNAGVGDGSTSGVTGNYTISGLTNGDRYQVSITGAFPRIYFNVSGDRDKLLSIEQWGSISWTSMNHAFSGCSNMVINAVDNPDLALVNDMSLMFYYATSFNQNIGSWDVSSVTNMSYTFGGTPFNQDISSWNVSNVTDMTGIFSYATNFNQDIGAWDVSSVTNMSNMFSNSPFNQDIATWIVSNVTNMNSMFSYTPFNQDIGSWDVSSANDMAGMFTNATAFNQNIGGWDVSNVTSMRQTFRAASAFNQDLSGWNVSNVTDMNFMFAEATLFNQNITNWDVSAVTDMSWMFYSASVFNQDIGSWNVSSVTNMSYMFNNAPVFNQNIGAWIVSNVTNMSYMFGNAITFNQDIGTWDVSSVTDMGGMFSAATAFNQNLGAWDVSSVTNMNQMFSNSPFNQDIGAWIVSNVINMGFMFTSTPFNQDIGAWDVSSVTDMANMFNGATAFDQDISTWDVSSVTTFQSTFRATPFNQDIGSWNVSSVTDLSGMFGFATSFNQDLASWDVSNVTNMSGTFNGASSFNQSLATWNISAVSSVFPSGMSGMLANTALSIDNYDATLIGWNALPSLPSGITLDAAGLNYCTADAARSNIISTYGWTINDAGFNCSTLAFITIWVTPDGQITIPTTGAGYNYSITWTNLDNAGVGDGSTSGVTGNYTISGLTNGDRYQISITGLFPRIYFINGPEKDKIQTIEQWGDISWTSMVSAFAGCTNLVLNALDNPDLTLVTNMSQMFSGASSFNADISGWDVSNVTSMSGMFSNSSFNQNIGSWNVSNVTDMGAMFANTPFNQDISPWDVSSVTNMSLMFQFTPFNQNIGSWNVSKVTAMVRTFQNSPFNQDIGTWDVSSVADFTNTFRSTPFNQDISSWDVSNATNMANMFINTLSFNQNLGAWDISSVTNMSGMLDNTALSIANYDATLIGWHTIDASETQIPTGLTLGASGLEFCTAIDDRNDLINTYSWAIVGDIENCGVCASPPTANAGPDQTINEGNTATLAGTLGGGASTLTWTTAGDGIFDDNTLNNAVYTPGTTDITNGSVTLTLTTDDPDGTGPCLAAIDALVLTINPVSSNTFNIFDGPDNNGNPITVGQTNIDVGSTTVGVNLDRDFTIENNQAVVVNISAITATDPAFAVINVPATVQPGTAEVFTIRLVAAEVGVFTADIAISSDFSPFSFSITGEVTAEEPGAITVYNALSPNGDGKHDYLEILGIDLFTNNRVVIMNRWGDLVFEANGYDNNNIRFEGLTNNGGELPSGTYFYQIDLGDGSGPQTGFISLRR